MCSMICDKETNDRSIFFDSSTNNACTDTSSSKNSFVSETKQPQMPSSWITRTLCSVPSIVSLDSDEGECSSASSSDTESPHTSFLTRERIRHSCLSCGHHCPEICAPLEVEVGYDVGSSIEVQRVDTSDYQKDANTIGHQIVLQKALGSSQTEPFAFMLCNGLDSWYGNDDESEDEPIAIEEEEAEIPTKKNRSSNPGSRRQRIQKLQLNIDPFDIDELFFAHRSMNEKYSPIEMNKRVYSFSDVDIKSPSSSCRTNFKQESNVLDISFGNACAFTRTSSTNLFDVEDSEDEDGEEFCYDSDPCELLISGKRIARRRIPENTIRNIKYEATRKEFQSNQLVWSKLRLVWHRKVDTSAFHDNQIAVCAWVENGSYINNRLIQPKLIWQEMLGKDQKDDRTVLISKNLHSIDLLDISKVVPLKRCNRTIYPYVKKNAAFLIKYDDFELVFETENEEKRDNVVEALKLTIARLGSMIMAGNRSVLDEFFTPVGNAVPGDIPHILQV